MNSVLIGLTRSKKMDTMIKKSLVLVLIFFSVLSINSCYAVAVGDSYGGGTVFCVSKTADTSNCKTENGSSGDYGLIMANEDQANYDLGPIKKGSEGGVSWSSEYKEIGPAAHSADDGRANTAAIIKALPGDNPKNNAAWLCHNYRDEKPKEHILFHLLNDEIKVLIPELDEIVVGYIGGYDDWYLPSKNELDKMYNYARANNLIGKGCSGSKAGGVQCLLGGEGGLYWSSTEMSSSANSRCQAWGANINISGWQFYYSKIHKDFGVRAVRVFGVASEAAVDHLPCYESSTAEYNEFYSIFEDYETELTEKVAKLKTFFKKPIPQTTINQILEHVYDADKEILELVLLNSPSQKFIDRALVYAVVYSCRDNVELLLQHKANPNTIYDPIEKAWSRDGGWFEENDYRSLSVLQIAIINKDIDTAILLLKHKADPNWHEGVMMLEDLGDGDLKKLMSESIHEAVKGALELAMPEIAASDCTFGGLISSNSMSFDDCIRAAMKAKKPKKRVESLETALHLAFEDDQPPSINLIKALLDAKADPNLSDRYGETALHLAFRHKQFSIEVIRLLLEANANANSLNHSGDTPLHVYCNSAITLSSLIDNLDDTFQMPAIVELLEKHNYGFNIQNKKGQTAINLFKESQKRVLEQFSKMHSDILKYH
jgi:ankyrin repeat protein